jgi:hypothetical protein
LKWTYSESLGQNLIFGENPISLGQSYRALGSFLCFSKNPKNFQNGGGIFKKFCLWATPYIKMNHFHRQFFA